MKDMPSGGAAVAAAADGNVQGGSGGGDTIHSIPYYKLFSFADSVDVVLMLVGTVGALGNGMSLPLMTVLFANMIDAFGQNSDDFIGEISKVSLQFVYLAIGTGVAATLQVACWMVTGERQSARIRNMYLKTILRQEIAFFDKETNTGEVVGRMSGDTVLIQDAMGEKVGKFIQSISTFVGGFAVAFVRGWLLTLVMMATIPPLVVAAALMAIILTKLASRGQSAYTEAAVVVDQAISSVRTVASFTGENRAVDKYRKSLKRAYRASVQEGLAAGLGLGSVMLVMFCGYSLGVWYGGKLVIDNDYTGGKVINVIFAVLTASFSLGQASPCITAFTAGQAAGFKMFETINRKPEIDAYDTGGKVPDDIRGDVELREVVFSYPSRPDEKVFDGFSLSISSGTSVALVGESGSGKSTVVSLIERFYDPQSGEVLIDGVNLKDFQLRWIRHNIGLVSQEPVLFGSSIRDNISYGKEGATAEEIKTVSELANASKFIDKLPQGLDTLVGEHGTQLSGGQKQRIAIARAMLKNPRILLLDEATSALDAESERIVQEALDRVMTNRTTVIVAHRLSTVQNADAIAVIHRGCIVEKGPHEELINHPDGAYSQLIRLQESNKVSDIDSVPSVRHSSLRNSLHRSISRGSSIGNSSRHSFSAGSLGVPVAVGIPEVSKEPENQEQVQKAPDVPLRRLASLNKPEFPVIIIGTIAAIANGVIMPIFGLLLSSAIDSFFKPEDQIRKDTKFWALMFFLLGVATIIAMPARTYLFGVAGSKLIRRIRLMCFEKVVHMDIAWFDNPENSSGAIGARLSTDAAMVRSLVGDSLALAVQNAASMVAGLVIAFYASWELSLIILVLAPLIALNGYIQLKFIQGFSANAKAMYEEASQVANDAVGSIRTVVSFSAEEKVIQLYKKKCEGPMSTGIKQGLISGIGFGVSFFLLFCTYATCFYAGGKLVESGRITSGDFFRVLFALAMAAIGISQSSSLAPDASKAKSAAASVFAILDHKPKIDSDDDSGLVLEQVKGHVEFKDVSFRYPTRPDIQIFQDLHFSAPSGKVIALVGESGCGKSTVISLLQRFYDPDSGHIFLDGTEIKMLKLHWFRQQMGLVGQEPVLFNDTIRANIAYGKEGEATESEIVAAAEAANAHKFISSLQQGYDTPVGERGIQLSGGQKQRVAIARAIVKEPKIMLLDEATSALDAESERMVQDALDRVVVSKTTIVIAHRLSTIKGADLIAVVKNGVIAEKGNHESLIKIKDGAYASLVALHAHASTSA